MIFRRRSSASQPGGQPGRPRPSSHGRERGGTAQLTQNRYAITRRAARSRPEAWRERRPRPQPLMTTQRGAVTAGRDQVMQDLQAHGKDVPHPLVRLTARPVSRRYTTSSRGVQHDVATPLQGLTSVLCNIASPCPTQGHPSAAYFSTPVRQTSAATKQDSGHHSGHT